MEDKEVINNSLEKEVARKVIVSTRVLWIYIAIISLVIFIINFILLLNISNIFSLLNLLLFLGCQIYCMHLIFDCYLFNAIYDNKDNLIDFDIAIKYLFDKKKKLDNMESRWHGTKVLGRISVLFLILQIILAVYLI